jgi:hypothetical protein
VISKEFGMNRIKSKNAENQSKIKVASGQEIQHSPFNTSQKKRMNFWKKAGHLIFRIRGMTINDSRAAMKHIHQSTDEISTKDDNELLQIIKQELLRSPIKPSPAMRELKNRGYSEQVIKFRIYF